MTSRIEGTWLMYQQHWYLLVAVCWNQNKEMKYCMSSSVPQNTLDSFSVVSERKMQIADQIVSLSWYKYFSSRHVESSLPSLIKATAIPPNYCPSMAMLASNTHEDRSENASVRSTMEQFHQQLSQWHTLVLKKTKKEHWNLSPVYPRCCQIDQNFNNISEK